MKLNKVINCSALLWVFSMQWSLVVADDTQGVVVPIPDDVDSGRVAINSEVDREETGKGASRTSDRKLQSRGRQNKPFSRRTVLGAEARRITLNGVLLPASSFYTPNSFVNSSENNVYAFLHGLSRVRTHRLKAGCEPDCSDAIAYLEFDLWKHAVQSLTLQYSVHSLSGRNGGTGFGEGQSIGFKYARKLSENSAFSFSGEHILQLDDTVDLGRNYFVGYSRFVRAKPGNRLATLGYVYNIGLGTGLYALYDNDLFTTSTVLTSPYFSEDRTEFTEEGDELKWGLVGSLSYYFSNRVAIGAEFIGFGLGFGMSVKPLLNVPLTFTGYLYDVIDNLPHGIPCAEEPCQPRLYGRVAYSF